MGKLPVEHLEILTKLLELSYDDLLKPSFSKIGKALGGVIGFTTIPFRGLGLVSDIVDVKIRKFLKDYRVGLNGVPDDRVSEVPPEILVPTLEKVRYVRDEDIREMFLKLLTKASDKETIHLAHPGFPTVISNISSDEAILIEHFSHLEKTSIPFVSVRCEFGPQKVERLGKTVFQEEGIQKSPMLTGIEDEVLFTFCHNIAVYFSNLEGLGLIRMTSGELAEHYYTKLIQKYEPMRKKLEGIGHGRKGRDYPFYFARGYYTITEYGRLFIDACVKD